MKERSMLSCTDAVPLILRRADGDALDATASARLEEHLAICAECRTTLVDQRTVASTLRSRPAETVSPLFASRLAERLDQAAGWFGIADWQAWTFRLAPVTVALVLATFLFSDQPATTSLDLEDWAVSTAEATSPATLLWNSDITSDKLLETLVTGEAPANEESGSAR
jgi:predicted anti-sigma-YlaC factor YlaD